ncbi:hypothetical protein LYZ86_22195 [Xanthomonas hortorum pv. cynarae]|uniref:hypothetical protein n=1 Tax=Xanthomonas hortorum TaxID=56454 RepID=UPI0011B08F57|nr:hypothetical protein [Xanthomonas hortorum]MCE4351885.1 hypothetical protein [Xanthomonas hortorum pv. cynarae]CAD0320854.1 hypothetical protein CFBP2044_16040 [Xanthomonas hortorum pv. cynarae]CAD0320863.1 hypothetical protein CFBP2044_16040 [Xanthomonas hortorum pv. cynarae]
MIEISKGLYFALISAVLSCLSACKQESLPQQRIVASQSQILSDGASKPVPQGDISKGSENSEFPSAHKENVSAQSSSESVDIQKLAVGFKEGMPYGDLRKSVISRNWKPKNHPECKKNVVGDDFQSICSKDPQQCAVCDDLPELNVCSGDGHCITEFSTNDGRKVLKVSTYGEIHDGLVEGKKSRLFVSWWDVSSSGD